MTSRDSIVRVEQTRDVGVFFSSCLFSLLSGLRPKTSAGPWLARALPGRVNMIGEHLGACLKLRGGAGLPHWARPMSKPDGPHQQQT